MRPCGGWIRSRSRTRSGCSSSARARDPQFIPDREADATIAALCERLDRLPLAIELAAARIGVMAPAEIVADLEARLGALGAGLSARELEVVGLVADGLANKTIASELHLSVRTVESHVRHVLAKAGLQNRTQLATWAREHIQ